MLLSVSKKVFGGSITSSGRSWYGSLMLDMRFWSSPIPRRSVVIRIWSLNSDMRRRGFYTTGRQRDRETERPQRWRDRRDRRDDEMQSLRSLHPYRWERADCICLINSLAIFGAAPLPSKAVTLPLATSLLLWRCVTE